MKPEELIELKQKTASLAEEPKATVVYLAGASRSVEPSVALGRLTRMEAITDKSVNEALLANSRRRLERLVNAMDRMDKGSYGRCLRCGNEIPVGRLKILPESLFCMECEEKKSAGRP